MTDKPDGYVAWHPLHGIAHESFVNDRTCMFRSWREAVNEAMSQDNDGWRIRPVKLVFLDLDEDKKDGR